MSLNTNNLTPPAIKQILDRDIVGQEQVKKTLAMLSFYYLQDVAAGGAVRSKTNALIIGDTGVGKTAVIKRLAQILNLPYAVGDASSLTTAGFKGNNIDSIFAPFLKFKGKYPNNKIPGIVFIDEIDKMISKDDNAVSANLQNEFLKIIEGGEVHLETSPYKGTGRVTIDTSQMMFIFAGSFPKLREIIKKRLAPLPGDPGRAEAEIIKQVKHEDLENFGLSREFLGRISTIKAMDPMNAKMLKRIFTEPQDSILNQYRDKLKIQGVELNFTPEAIDYIVDQALENNTGARGLAGITQEIMDNVLYEIPGQKNVQRITVTRAAAQNKEPEITYSASAAPNRQAPPPNCEVDEDLLLASVSINRMLATLEEICEFCNKLTVLDAPAAETKNSKKLSAPALDRQREELYAKIRADLDDIKIINKVLGPVTERLTERGYRLAQIIFRPAPGTGDANEASAAPSLSDLRTQIQQYKTEVDRIIEQTNEQIAERIFYNLADQGSDPQKNLAPTALGAANARTPDNYSTPRIMHSNSLDK